jgi:ABC-2 type transport system permease protein
MMKRLKILFFEEVKVVAKDHSILLTIIVAPLLYAFFLGSIYLYKDEAKVKFGVVDLDRTTSSRSIIQALNSTQKIDIINEGPNFNLAVEKTNSLETNGFLLIPNGFEKGLKKLKGADVQIYLNTTKFLPSNDINKTISKTLLMAGAGVRLKYFQAKKGMTREQALTQVMPLTPNIKLLYNPTANYGDFLLPGLFLLILHQTLLIGFGESIAISRKKKKFREWIKNGNGNVFIMINGRIIYYLFLFSSMSFFFFEVVFPFFNIGLQGSGFVIALLTFFFLLSVAYYTIFFASFFKTQSGVMEVFAFSSYPIFLISGFSWPQSALPTMFQWLGDLVPLTPYYNSFIRVTQMGAGFQHITWQLVHLIVLTMVAYLLAHFRIKYLVKSEEKFK